MYNFTFFAVFDVFVCCTNNVFSFKFQMWSWSHKLLLFVDYYLLIICTCPRKRKSKSSVFCPWPTSGLNFEGTRYIQTSVEGSTPSHHLFLIDCAFTVLRKVICFFKPSRAIFWVFNSLRKLILALLGC